MRSTFNGAFAKRTLLFTFGAIITNNISILHAAPYDPTNRFHERDYFKAPELTDVKIITRKSIQNMQSAHGDNINLGFREVISKKDTHPYLQDIEPDADNFLLYQKEKLDETDKMKLFESIWVGHSLEYATHRWQHIWRTFANARSHIEYIMQMKVLLGEGVIDTSWIPKVYTPRIHTKHGNPTLLHVASLHDVGGSYDRSKDENDEKWKYTQDRWATLLRLGQVEPKLIPMKSTEDKTAYVYAIDLDGKGGTEWLLAVLEDAHKKEALKPLDAFVYAKKIENETIHNPISLLYAIMHPEAATRRKVFIKYALKGDKNISTQERYKMLANILSFGYFKDEHLSRLKQICRKAFKTAVAAPQEKQENFAKKIFKSIENADQLRTKISAYSSNLRTQASKFIQVTNPIIHRGAVIQIQDTLFQKYMKKLYEQYSGYANTLSSTIIGNMQQVARFVLDDSESTRKALEQGWATKGGYRSKLLKVALNFAGDEVKSEYQKKEREKAVEEGTAIDVQIANAIKSALKEVTEGLMVGIKKVLENQNKLFEGMKVIYQKLQ